MFFHRRRMCLGGVNLFVKPEADPETSHGEQGAILRRKWIFFFKNRTRRLGLVSTVFSRLFESTLFSIRYCLNRSVSAEYFDCHRSITLLAIIHQKPYQSATPAYSTHFLSTETKQNVHIERCMIPSREGGMYQP